ncbi:MAG: nucleotidyl transferase AbiEii/AbiGii toxin family protein [Bacteroidetes bacterium]|nr:nucleotidyl transferase AbiEii/AbiGii toxin family protein [Bacteroidota bacterium]
MQLHWDILDKKRKAILPLLKTFSEDGFYLAGGTGLALQLGHRDSIDFDFFKIDHYDTDTHILKLNTVFNTHDLTVTQQEKDTVSCVVDGSIQMSFFSYPYQLQSPLIQSDYFNLASVEDIACMKVSAISGRATEKDYVDLYFILQHLSLNDLIDFCRKKFRTVDEVVILKSLSFFDDVEKEHILFKGKNRVTLKQLQKYFMKLTDEHMRQSELQSVRKKDQGKQIER